MRSGNFTWQHFVESQYSGLKIFPFNVCDLILGTRRQFFARLFNLPKDFSSVLVNLFLSLEPPAIKLLKARSSLLKRLKKHPVREISSSMSLKNVLFKKQVGWTYESYFLCKKINTELHVSLFDFSAFCTDLALSLAQKCAKVDRANGSDVLGFFLLFQDASHFLSF